MRLLVSVVLAVGLVSCERYRAVLPAPTPLVPAQAVVELAVAAEDATEDAVCDRHCATFLESAADVLNTPWLVAWVVVGMQVSLWMTVYDAVTGEAVNPDRRMQEVMTYLPARYASPVPWQSPAPALTRCEGIN